MSRFPRLGARGRRRSRCTGELRRTTGHSCCFLWCGYRIVVLDVELRGAGTASGHRRRRCRHIRRDRTRISITVTHIRSRISTRRRSRGEVAGDRVTVIRRALTVNHRGNTLVSHHLPFPLPAAGGAFGGAVSGGFAPANGGFPPFAFASSAADCGGFFFPATVSSQP